MKRRSQKHNPQCGFTLIETTIAFAIAVVTLVSLVGLMGSVIATSGETVDRFATARISQKLVHEFQMKDWREIRKMGDQVAPVRYFDEKGEEVLKDDFTAIYAVRVSLEEKPDLPELSEAGKSYLLQNTASEENGRRVLVEISTRIQSADPFAEERFVRKFTSLLVKLDQ